MGVIKIQLLELIYYASFIYPHANNTGNVGIPFHQPKMQLFYHNGLIGLFNE